MKRVFAFLTMLYASIAAKETPETKMEQLEAARKLLPMFQINGVWLIGVNIAIDLLEKTIKIPVKTA